MKVFLLHRDRDFEAKHELRDSIFYAMTSGEVFAVANARRDAGLERKRNPALVEAQAGTDGVLTQDLELQTLWNAMAAGDEFLYETAKRVTLSSLTDPDEIRYRQHVLADCIANSDTISEIYTLTLEALENERQTGSLWSGADPDRILSRSVQILKLQVDVLKRLRKLGEEHADQFESEGFDRFFAMLKEELDDEYLATVEHHLDKLAFRRGLLESAALGKGLKGRGYVVRTQRELNWKERFLPGNRPAGYSFTIPPRDESGFRALQDIRGRGLNHLADAVARSADHVKSFFAILRIEVAFYLGCLNLERLLNERAEPTCFPTPIDQSADAFSCEGLYDVCLALHVDEHVIGNELDADSRSLIVITGANQGGKSTFLRSVGLAQLMMQAGMFVGSNSLRANVCSGLFTHYKREEDAAMEGGKLDEELARMSAIAERIQPRSLLLCNESFASTNEREGSQIAREVVRALLARRVKVFFVTHMYDLSHGFELEQSDAALFLRAERQQDGKRTFKLLEGEPLPTSYGADSYRRIFGSDDEAVASSR